MKTILISALLATASPIAVAQNDTGDRVQLTPVAQSEMTGATSPAQSANTSERDQVETALKANLEGDVDASVINAALTAYDTADFEPLWTRKGAASLKSLSANLFDYGLAPSDVLASDLDALIAQRFDARSDAERIEADVAVSAAWLRVASAVSAGLKDDIAAERAETEDARLLSGKLISAGKGDAEKAIAAFEPDYPQYAALKSALADYRALREEGGWLAIPDGDVIEAGMKDSRVPAIRKRLKQEGYDSGRSLVTLMSDAVEAARSTEGALVETASSKEAAAKGKFIDQAKAEEALDPEIYDEKLVEAVKTFQARHGIEPDGVVGPSTLEAMNESIDSKIARIADSMDRWRKQGAADERYVWANIPSYTVEGWNDGKREITMRSIVGTPAHETPAFSDEIEYAVANPRWYAPVSILRDEKMPKLQQDPGYASRANFKVYDRSSGAEVSAYSVNWNDPSAATEYRLVQESGAGNALGELKIIFPNQYSVYLHGTPGQHLFDRAERAFSHGCIRLEEPTRMAEWIASFDPAAEPKAIEAAVESRQNERIDYESRIPIHITYMTVTVNEDGTVNFWRDIYDRTEGILQVEKFAPLHRDNADPVKTAELERR